METAIPLYAQIETTLAESIADGSLPVGAQVPTEDVLIERFKLSRTMVRKAIQNLASRGLVEIRRGKGTFVAHPKITQDITELTGFVEDMLAAGRHPTARLVGTKIMPACELVAKQLQLSVGIDIMRIQRVRLADSIPISFDETYLPRKIGEKIITNDLETEPIFSLLEEKYNIPLIEAGYKLEAVLAAGEVATFLKVQPGSPIFRIERTSYSGANQPVDFEKLYYRGDLIRFVTRLARRSAIRVKERNA